MSAPVPATAAEVQLVLELGQQIEHRLAPAADEDCPRERPPATPTP